MAGLALSQSGSQCFARILFYPGDGEQAYQDLVAAHGNSLVFTQEKVKLFVDERESKDVLTRLCQRIKDNLVAYLGNPKFASLYVLKKYGDLRDRENWSKLPTNEEE
jgi:hypothetical protein